ncbi:hypothetical protein CEXT_90741 [Caerostris extrusa]|uniref:Uncharacterized protein n=1 Tax=Caerostris extrusa TaxID=172846 RepID=A0AAV4P6G6_CAEEX|nr:hypothetical protein CEXT_90741 [Caerostris extrusa]
MPDAPTKDNSTRKWDGFKDEGNKGCSTSRFHVSGRSDGGRPIFCHPGDPVPLRRVLARDKELAGAVPR